MAALDRLNADIVLIVDDVPENLSMLHDALDVSDDLTRRLIAFHPYAAFRSIDGACGPVQLYAAGGAADIRRAQVESVAGDVDLDRVDVPAI